MQESANQSDGDLPAPRRRAVHISTVHSALDARIFYREAAALRDHGYEVVVVGVHPEDAVIDGIAIRGLAAVPGRLGRIARSWYRGLKAVRANAADIYHFHDPELIAALVLAKWLWGKRVVYDAHEDVALVMLKDWIPRWLRRPAAWLLGAADALAARRADAVVVPTRLLHEKYAPLARRVQTFINFPAPDFLKHRDAANLPWDRRRNEVVHLGTLSLGRLETIVGVAQRFLARHEDWTWTLLGVHAYAEQWFRENVRDDVGGRLRVIGIMPHTEVPTLLAAARLSINYHSLASRQIQVAIPLKVFEYLACGLPVVSTRVPLLAELVEDCPAVAFVDEDPDAYLAAVEAMAARDDLAALGGEARRFSDERFNCRVEGDKLAALYEDILGKAGERG